MIGLKRITNGKYITKGYEYRGYEIRNHGYYPPDKCVWWEAIDINTGQGDFHANRLKDVKKLIDESLKQ